MLIDLRTSDRPLGVKALAIYEKMVDAAIKASQNVYAPTLYLDTEKGRIERATEWLNETLDDFELGESREIDIPGPLATALANAASVYLSQLTKLAEKESDLLVPVNETDEVRGQVASLADRLRGQIEMAGVATVSVNGSEPVSLDDLARGVEHLAAKRAD